MHLARFARKLLLFWELPQLVLALFIYTIVKKNIKARKKYKKLQVYFVEGFPGGISLSFMTFLDIKYRDNLRVIDHEYGHSRQSIILGWLYLPVVGLPSIIRAAIWTKFKLAPSDYYRAFPENWADRLAGIKN